MHTPSGTGTDKAEPQPLRSPMAVAPSDEHADVALRASLIVMAPIARWLIRSGVQYGAFASALKSVFVQVAREEIQASGRKATDSALSVLSGVHRKDIRQLSQHKGRDFKPKSVSLVSQVFTRWVTDPRYRDEQGRPRKLPRLGAQDSFEALSRELSTDVHPRTVLEELVRLRLVRLDGDEVELLTEAFVPAEDHAELAALLSANGADHLAAAVHNLTTNHPRFLEQAVFADGLSERSALELSRLARELWAEVFQKMVTQASARCAADRDEPRPHRMRFGVYYYSEPERREDGPSARAADQA